MPDVSTAPFHTIDEAIRSGIIRILVEGFFDLGSLRDHFSQNAEVVDRWRSQGRPIRVIIDATRLRPHSAEGQEFVTSSIQRIYVPGDRVAIMVESSLTKMQMRRTHTHGDIIEFFVSDGAAMRWLQAWD